MRRRPNPYRVLAHALDIGDLPLAEALSLRLAPGRPSPPSAVADAAVERLMRLLAVTGSPD